MSARFLTAQLNCTHPDLTASVLELEPADVKSPHTSELGWGAGTGEPKSRRGAVFACASGTVCAPPGGGRIPPAFAPGGGGSRPPAMGRGLAPPASFFLMFPMLILMVCPSLKLRSSLGAAL